MSTTTHTQRSVDACARIIQIEKDHADVNWSTVNHYAKHVGLRYKDAMHAEELEREIDRLEATAAAVGLSDEERARLNSVSAELDRFVSAGTCHAEKQAAKKQRDRKRSKPDESPEALPIEVQRTSNVVSVCTDTEARMKALLHLTTPAGFDPCFSFDQVAAYEWELVFHSITEASRFEQLAHDASRLAAA